METWIATLLSALALPQYGLSTVFVVAFISATLLPMGSEPAVFGLVKLNADLFWPAVLKGAGLRMPNAPAPSLMPARSRTSTRVSLQSSTCHLCHILCKASRAVGN